MVNKGYNTYASRIKQSVIWIHGLVAGVYLSDSGADTISAYLWNIWWMFIWSLCLAAIFYIMRERYIDSTLHESDVQMPRPDLDKYKQDEPLK